MKEVTIFLTEPIAKQFLAFQKHYETFTLMLESGVFDQKGATITLNFDKFGVLRNIGRADFLYIHGVDFQNVNPKVIQSSTGTSIAS